MPIDERLKRKARLSAIWLLLLGACDSRYSDEKCQDLAFKSFRGNTTLVATWEEHCEDRQGLISISRCQQAFNELAGHGKAELLQKKFGEKIMNCFNPKDLQILVK